MPFKFSTPAESPGFLLWQVHNKWQRQLRKSLRPFDVTHVQFVCLASLLWLSKKQSEISQVQLATCMGADVMMVSNVVRSLEQKRYIKRGAHSGDSRALSLQLTAKGRTVVIKALVVVETFDTRFFKFAESLKAFVTDLKGLLEEKSPAAVVQRSQVRAPDRLLASQKQILAMVIDHRRRKEADLFLDEIHHLQSHQFGFIDLPVSLSAIERSHLAEKIVLMNHLGVYPCLIVRGHPRLKVSIQAYIDRLSADIDRYGGKIKVISNSVQISKHRLAYDRQSFIKGLSKKQSVIISPLSLTQPSIPLFRHFIADLMQQIQPKKYIVLHPKGRLCTNIIAKNRF